MLHADWSPGGPCARRLELRALRPCAAHTQLAPPQPTHSLPWLPRRRPTRSPPPRPPRRRRRRAARSAPRCEGLRTRARAPQPLTRAAARRPPQTESYKIYIYKVLKQVHPDTGISSKAMSIMCVPARCPARPRAAPRARAPPRADAGHGFTSQELVHQRHLREDRHRGGQAGALQQEADGDQPRDPDRGAPHPAGRAGQARRVGGHQGRDQVHLLVSAPPRFGQAPRALPRHHHPGVI